MACSSQFGRVASSSAAIRPVPVAKSSVRFGARRAKMPRISDQAYYAFGPSTDYLRIGAVLIQKMPF